MRAHHGFFAFFGLDSTYPSPIDYQRKSCESCWFGKGFVLAVRMFSTDVLILQGSECHLLGFHACHMLYVYSANRRPAQLFDVKPSYQGFRIFFEVLHHTYDCFTFLFKALKESDFAWKMNWNIELVTFALSVTKVYHGLSPDIVVWSEAIDLLTFRKAMEVNAVAAFVVALTQWYKVWLIVPAHGNSNVFGWFQNPLQREVVGYLKILSSHMIWHDICYRKSK